MTAEDVSAPEARFTAEQMRATGLHPEITLQELRSEITVLSGSGANMVVLDHPEGKILVDSGFAISQPEIEASLSLISPHPVRFLINTHCHFDHTDGNEWLHTSGATIIAHRRTRERLNLPQSIPAFRYSRGASREGALPSLTFDQQMRVDLGNESVLLRRYTPAHTDSDTAVYFERLDVLHLGDTWFNGIYPFIDYDSGGSIDGLIEATRENLELTNSHTLIVPGHGSVGSREDLVDSWNMLTETRHRVATLKASGLSLADTLAKRVTASFDSKYGAGFIPADLFVALVYRGV